MICLVIVMDERKQFTFYRSFWEAIKGLPKKDRLPILEAIISYGLDGETPSSLSQSQFAFFLLVKPVLDTGRRKAYNGKQGGSKKKANCKQTTSEKELEIEKEIEIEIEREKEKEKEKEQPASKEGKSFTLFWADFPNKADRGDAWEAWKALNPDDRTVGKIMAGLDAWKKSGQWLDDGGRYIPSAAKWLTKRRWEHPPAAAVNAQGRQLDEDEIAAIKRMMAQDGQNPAQIEGV